MSCIYHPVARCETKHTPVRIDQTQRRCALDHHCPASSVCPAGDHFIEVYEAYRRPMAWDRSGGTCV